MSSKEKPIDLSPPFYVVAALRFCETFFPSLALKLAKYFFFTPIRFPRPAREQKAFEQAKRNELMIGKKRITVYSWGKENGKKILLVHGWSGRATQFFKLRNFLVSRGFHVYAIDAPAHGENTGAKQTHMLEFVEAIERVNMTYGPFYGAVGHSLGGLAILNAYNKGFGVEKIVTIAAPCSIENVIKDFSKRIRAGKKTEKGLINHLVETYKVPIEAFGGHTQAETIRAKGLIVHDIHDHDVSVEEAKMLKDAWKNARLFTTKRQGHRRILMAKDTLALVADFFGKRPAPAPRTNNRGDNQATQNNSKEQSAQNASQPNTPKVNAEDGNNTEVKRVNKRRRPARKKPANPSAESNKIVQNAEVPTEVSDKPVQQKKRPVKRRRPNKPKPNAENTTPDNTTSKD
jgi:esterase/lipase